MIESLAASLLTNFILPYLRDGADAIAKKVTDEAGEVAAVGAVAAAKRVWDRVKGLFGEHPEVESLRKKIEKPDATEATLNYFVQTLQELLDEHPDVKVELEELVTTPVDGAGDSTLVQVMHTSGVTVTMTNVTASGHGVIKGVECR